MIEIKEGLQRVLDEPSSSDFQHQSIPQFNGDKSVSRKKRLVSIFLLSAIVITFARVLAPFEVGTDQAVQLEAAQRLVEGFGLTTTNDATHTSQDISIAPQPGYVVQWPPGFSLIVAAFLFVGVPLLASLKIIYAVITIIGWLGWAIVASVLAPGPITVFSRTLNVHYLLAAVLPILSTPLWKGTDIFLWAGVPFFVLLLWRASSQGQRSFTLILLAGLLFGALCAMRYVSAFLALPGTVILFQFSYPNLKLFLKRFLVFVLPSLIAVFLLFAYVKSASVNASGNLPAQLTESSGIVARLEQRVDAVLTSAPITSNLIFGFPLIEQVTFGIDSKLLNYAVGTTCLLVLLCLPLIVIKSLDSSSQWRQKSLALSLSFLPISLAIFLILLRLLSDSALFRIRRYYEPLILCGVLVFYAIASKSAARGVVQRSSTVIVTLFTAYILLFNSALLVIPQRRYQFVRSVLAFTPANTEVNNSTSQDIRFPSWRLYSWKESSKLEIRRLYEAHPDALFIVQEYPSFIFDRFRGEGLVPGKNLIDYPGANYLSKAYTSRPIKIFWVVASATKLDFVDDTALRLIHSDPVERTSIYESDLPAGYRFISSQK